MGTQIVGWGSAGDGRAADGRFVAGAVPQDRLDETGAVQPGPRRATPPCRHFGRCGGCQLQHADNRALAGFALERALVPLARAGAIPREVRPVHLSPPRSRRRVALRGRRTAAGMVLGFNARGEHRVIDIVECPVMAPQLFALVEPARALLGTVLPQGEAASLQMTLTDGGVDMVLGGYRRGGLEDDARFVRFALDHDLARLALDRGLGPEPLVEQRAPEVRPGGGRAVRLPPGAFLQPTADGEAALVAAVAQALDRPRRVADLFAGLGTFALPLAGAGARVLAVEGQRSALDALAAAGAPGVAVEHRDLFRRPLDEEALARFDAVVVDPPRAGAQAQASVLARSSLARVVMVSCNPATLARDAALLVAGGFRPRTLWPIAQFRWSTHVEAVVGFERA